MFLKQLGYVFVLLMLFMRACSLLIHSVRFSVEIYIFDNFTERFREVRGWTFSPLFSNRTKKYFHIPYNSFVIWSIIFSTYLSTYFRIVGCLSRNLEFIFCFKDYYWEMILEICCYIIIKWNSMSDF